MFLVDKFQILSEKFCFKFITDPKWFIPDPTPDPAKSFGSDRFRIQLRIRIHNTELQCTIIVFISRSRGKELWTQLAAPPLHPAAEHLLYHLPPPLRLQVQEGPAGLPEGKQIINKYIFECSLYFFRKSSHESMDFLICSKTENRKEVNFCGNVSAFNLP